MLRITTQENSSAITFVLEGKCRGPWVAELEQCWRNAVARAGSRKLRVNLGQVGFVDKRGKELLAKMCAAGVELIAAGLMITSLVEEIRASCSQTAKQHAQPDPTFPVHRPEKYRVGRFSSEEV